MSVFYLGTTFGGIFYAKEFVGAMIYYMPKDKPGLLFWQKHGEPRASVENFIGELEGFLSWIVFTGGAGGNRLRLTAADEERFRAMGEDFDEHQEDEVDLSDEPSLADVAFGIFDIKNLVNVGPGEVVAIRYNALVQIRENLREYIDGFLENPEGDFEETEDFVIEGKTPFLGGLEAMALIWKLTPRLTSLPYLNPGRLIH